MLLVVGGRGDAGAHRDEGHADGLLVGHVLGGDQAVLAEHEAVVGHEEHVGLVQDLVRGQHGEHVREHVLHREHRAQARGLRPIELPDLGRAS